MANLIKKYAPAVTIIPGMDFHKDQTFICWANDVEMSLPTRVDPIGRFSNHFLFDLRLIDDLVKKVAYDNL